MSAVIRCGGVGDENEANQDIQSMVDGVSWKLIINFKKINNFDFNLSSEIKFMPNLENNIKH